MVKAIRVQASEFATFVVGAYLLVCLARFSFFPANIKVSFLLFFIAIVALILGWGGFRVNFFDFSVFPVLLIIGIVFSSLMTQRWDRTAQWISFVIMGYGISFLLVYGGIGSKIIELIFFCCAAYFALFIIGGDPASNVFSHISYNGISMVMLVACVTLYIVRSMALERLVVIPALITYVICWYGVGRGGVISSAILVILISIIIFSRDRLIIKLCASIAIPVAHLLLISFPYLGFDVLNFDSCYDCVFRESFVINVNRSELQEPRLFVLINYVRNLDVPRFLFGVNVFSDSFSGVKDLGYCYHNSFLALHSRVGVFSLVFGGFLIWALGIFIRYHRLYFSLLFVIILRWFVDEGMFFESFDYLFYFFILCAFQINKHVAEMACQVKLKTEV